MEGSQGIYVVVLGDVMPPPPPPPFESSFINECDCTNEILALGRVHILNMGTMESLYER